MYAAAQTSGNFSESNLHFNNAEDWQETLQNILNYGQQGVTVGQNTLHTITGEQPITGGELPDGAGDYVITTGEKRDESKIIGIPTPYFWGGLAFVGAVGLFVFAFYKKK